MRTDDDLRRDHDTWSQVDMWGLVTVRGHRAIPIAAVVVVTLAYLWPVLQALITQASLQAVIVGFMRKWAWIFSGSVLALWAASILYAGAREARGRPFMAGALFLAAAILALEVVATLLRVLGYV